MSSPPPHATCELLTGPQPAGIAVLRLEGAAAWSFLQAHLAPPPRPPGPTLTYHRLLGPLGNLIDDVVLAHFRGHRWEITLHGGPEIVRQAQNLAASFGLTPPEPTPREDDVTRCVEHLLPLARTELAVRTLLAQPGLRHLPVSPGDALHTLLSPPRVVLYGRPNVGKSSLLNALARQPVAITADLPGTTRDFVSTHAQLTGTAGTVVVELIDTPGSRDTHDPIEAAAIRLAQPVRDTAAVRVLVLDSSQPLCHDDHTELAAIAVGERPRTLVAANKCDLHSPVTPRLPGMIPVSATTGQGLPALAEAILTALGIHPDTPTRRHRLPLELLRPPP